MHLGRQRFVFDQLEQLVFKHHRAGAAGDVFADLEHRLIRLRDMAFFQVFQQVLHAHHDALAFRVQRFFQCVRVQRQKVAGAGGVYPLLHRKADAAFAFGVAFHAVGQLHQRARVQQVKLRRYRCGGVGQPFVAGKAAQCR